MNSSCEVFDRIRCELESSSKHWVFLEKKVCLKSWKILHGIGFFDTLAIFFNFNLKVFEGLVQISGFQFNMKDFNSNLSSIPTRSPSSPNTKCCQLRFTTVQQAEGCCGRRRFEPAGRFTLFEEGAFQVLWHLGEVR